VVDNSKKMINVEKITIKNNISSSIYFNNQLILDYGDWINKIEGGVVFDCTDCPQCYTIKFQLRKSNKSIIFIPNVTFSRINEACWYMSVEQYKTLQNLDNNFPTLDEIKLLTKKDCAHIFLYELPKQISSLDKINNLYLNTDAIEGEKIVTILKQLLWEYQNSNDPVILFPRSKNNEITIILDTPDYFEWKSLCKSDKGYNLCLNPGYKVKPL